MIDESDACNPMQRICVASPSLTQWICTQKATASGVVAFYCEKFLLKLCAHPLRRRRARPARASRLRVPVVGSGME